MTGMWKSSSCHTGKMAKSSGNGHVGTGFAARFRLQTRTLVLQSPVGSYKATTPSSFSSTTNRLS